jgi:hypothetical protein
MALYIKTYGSAFSFVPVGVGCGEVPKLVLGLGGNRNSNFQGAFCYVCFLAKNTRAYSNTQYLIYPRCSMITGFGFWSPKRAMYRYSA